MSVYNKLSTVRKLSNSSLTSIIDITNLNFADLSSAILEFLKNIEYNETTNSFSVYSGDFDFVNIADKFSLKLDGIPTFTIDSLGRAEGQELLVKVAETKRLRLTDFNDWPDVGVPGEIIYTGIQNQRPEFGEDFIGYLQSKGWVSLTEPGTVSFITLYELMGSPPVPACPSPNTGILWIGPPGYATASVPTTQTIYYTDENCEVYDLTIGAGGSQGPQGSQGAAGVQGPQGSQGAAGEQGAPASPNKSVQFNNSGVFGGSSNFTFDSATNNLALTGTVDVTGASIKLEHTLNSGVVITSKNLSSGVNAYSQLFLQGGASTNGIQNGIFTFSQSQTINTYLRSSSLISTVASDLGNTNVAKQIYFIAAANSGSQFEWHYATGNTLSAGSIRMYLTSGGVLWTNGSASATALTIRNTPTANPSGTQVLVRNTSTGNVEYRAYGGLYSQTAQSAAITATVAESSLIGTGVGSLTVPANGFVVGDSFHANLFGEVTAANAETLQIRVKAGSVVLADFGAYAMPTTSNKSWELNITFTIRAIGAAGVAAIAANGTFSFTHGGGSTFEANKVNTVNSTTFDTTASNTLDITLQWGSTNATNTISSDQFVLHKIY
jgi:hypothetical protein